MQKMIFQSFGSTITDQRLAVINGPVYGVRIASDSEIDQCRITLGGEQPQAYPGASALDGSKLLTFVGEAYGAIGDFKVSVRRPLIAALPADRRDFIITPSRFTYPASSVGTAALRAPMLALEVLTDPHEAMWCPTERAPLDRDVEMDVPSGATRTLFFALYGRRWHSVEINAEGSGTLTSTILAMRSIYGPTSGSGQGRQWTVAAAAAGDLEWEGDGDIDLLQIQLAGSGGSDARAHLHIRSED